MKQSLTLLICVMSLFSYAQNVGIGTKKPQNKLHVAGGLRIDSLAAKKDSGLILHNKNGDVYSLSLTGKTTDVLRGDGTFATASAAALTDAWLLGGNAGTDSNTNFLGTTDDQPLKFRINNNLFGGFDRNIHIGLTGTSNNPSGVDAGNNNVGIGNASLTQNSGASNVALGYRAAYSNATGNYNIALGENSLFNNLTGSNNIALGRMALLGNGMPGAINTPANNIAVGETALGALQSGNNNIAIGTGAIMRLETGSQNIAIGYQAMNNAQGAQNLTAIGYQALFAATSGIGNTAVGQNTLFRTTTGNYNTANGSQALYSNTTGGYNSAFGYKALFTSSTGTHNTATGFKALNFTTTGSRNTASGFEALNTNTTGNNNTAIGYRADVTSANLSNATAIGYEAKVNASNKVRIGNASVTVIEGQVPFTTPSDGRFKYNVREDVGGLDFILKLRPVTYQFDVKKFDNIGDVTFASAKNEAYEKAALIRRTGFIAQEVEKAAEETNYNFSGVVRPESQKEHYSLSYESFVVPLVKAVQELSQQVQKQNQVIEKQQQMIDQLLRNAKNK